MWNDRALPFIVPVIVPLPIMLRPVSLMFIVPCMLVPVWLTVQVNLSDPEVSDDAPV